MAAAGAKKRVLNGRPIASGAALLLVLDTRARVRGPTPNEIHRVDLRTGEGSVVYTAPEGLFVTDLDWIDVDR